MPKKKIIRTPPFQSRLIPYEKEIMKAWYQRDTLKQISQDLESRYDITVPISTLGAFIKRRRNRPDPHATPTNPTRKKPTPAAMKKLEEFIHKDPLELRKEYDRKIGKR